MQLRSGKITNWSPAYCRKQKQLMCNLVDARVSSGNCARLPLLTAIYLIFENMNSDLPKQDLEEYCGYIVTAYEKSFTLMYQLIEMTYSEVRRPKSDKEKVLFVRTLLEIDRIQEYLTGLIKKHQAEMFQFGHNQTHKKGLAPPDKNQERDKARLYMENLSKCLCHIYRVEHDETFYGVYEYGNGEYTDIEIFDYYFGENCYEPENIDYDDFLQTTKIYFDIPRLL